MTQPELTMKQKNPILPWLLMLVSALACVTLLSGSYLFNLIMLCKDGIQLRQVYFTYELFARTVSFAITVGTYLLFVFLAFISMRKGRGVVGAIIAFSVLYSALMMANFSSQLYNNILSFSQLFVSLLDGEILNLTLRDLFYHFNVCNLLLIAAMGLLFAFLRVGGGVRVVEKRSASLFTVSTIMMIIAKLLTFAVNLIAFIEAALNMMINTGSIGGIRFSDVCALLYDGVSAALYAIFLITTVIYIAAYCKKNKNPATVVVAAEEPAPASVENAPEATVAEPASEVQEAPVAEIAPVSKPAPEAPASPISLSAPVMPAPVELTAPAEPAPEETPAPVAPPAPARKKAKTVAELDFAPVEDEE